ncbi:hypothetical protein [Thiothrix winogradskyi]|uniref:Uncharacterized protein n=1 Tax=Thiothrix winogradskyi TaxID=96472 RepID=A0ABY3SYH9_9GAMM|nr:hypothetical protein [Thiothrix winogradskyi]UJS23795.1 hypothetical protein L2Y54_17920 [Thiothrix winogradskyi]
MITYLYDVGKSHASAGRLTGQLCRVGGYSSGAMPAYPENARECRLNFAVWVKLSDNDWTY